MAVGRMAPTSARGGVPLLPRPLGLLPLRLAIPEDASVACPLTPSVRRVLATLARTAIFTPDGSRVHQRQFNFKRQNLSSYPLPDDGRFCL